MKTLWLILLVLPLSMASFSQHYILDKRSKIKKSMEKFYAEGNKKFDFSETDSSITYVLKDSFSLPLTTIFYFNEHDRCIRIEDIFSCDSCLQQSMQRSLREKYVNWNKVAENKYYAGFPYNTLMEQVRINDKFILRFSKQKKKDVY